MLTREDDIDVHALRRQGWTIFAIARHLGKDRKTISAYLAGSRGIWRHDLDEYRCRREIRTFSLGQFLPSAYGKVP